MILEVLRPELRTRYNQMFESLIDLPAIPVEKMFTQSPQLFVPSGLINRVPASAKALAGVSSIGWHVKLCDPMWHWISRDV